MHSDPSDYLGDCQIIDIRSPDVARIAKQLAVSDSANTAQKCFEFVRDEIRHSSDYRLNPVTCRASEVLRHRTGYCYAKSHLLCALLRANEIPAGLCYQRLSTNEDSSQYCLHGLNAIYLEDFGWYRVDARGNRTGIDSQFSPPTERLAFTTVASNEYDLPEIHVSPLRVVVECLQVHQTWEAVAENLPDVPD
jgi:transglutaminase-like putative cysteine protease